MSPQFLMMAAFFSCSLLGSLAFAHAFFWRCASDPGAAGIFGPAPNGSACAS